MGIRRERSSLKDWKELKQEEKRGKKRFLERLAQTRDADKEIEEYELPPHEEYPENDTRPNFKP